MSRTAIYASAKAALLGGTLSLMSATIKAIPVRDAYEPDFATHAFLSDIPLENRATSAQLVTGKALVQLGETYAWRMDSPTFLAVPAGDPIGALVLFEDTGVEATSKLIGYFDYFSNLPLTPIGTNLTFTWPLYGVLILTEGVLGGPQGVPGDGEGGVTLPDGDEDDVLGLGTGGEGLKNLGQAAEVPEGGENELVGIGATGGLVNAQPVGMIAGDMIYWTGTAWAKVAGTITEGYVIKAVSGVPTWAEGGGETAPTVVLPDLDGLTSLFDTSYAGAPWVATVGTNLVSLGAPPSVGSAVNGFTPADYNGTTHNLSMDPTQLLSLFGASAGGGFDLIWVDATVSDPGAGTERSGMGIWDDAGGTQVGLYHSTGGVAFCVSDSGGHKAAVTPCSIGAWHLVQYRYSGTNIEVRVDGGAWSVTACGDPVNLTAVLRFGNSWLNNFFDGKSLCRATSTSRWDDTTFDAIRTTLNLKYGLAI